MWTLQANFPRRREARHIFKQANAIRMPCYMTWCIRRLHCHTILSLMSLILLTKLLAYIADKINPRNIENAAHKEIS